MTTTDTSHKKSPIQLFGALAVALVSGAAALGLAIFGAIVISGCVVDCGPSDLGGGIPLFVAATVSGATSIGSVYWIFSTGRKRTGWVLTISAIALGIPLAIWAAILSR
ncbi:MAG: hypothetical protein JJE47_02630 [Acidimicrobiia bacterium]|nr:hypothetical protein [Acidimicrobiia bacterium]